MAVLGAGIAGLVAARLLRGAGYTCSILEARSRAGGRVWTLRSGDRIEETDSVQNIGWAAHRDLYFEAGAARICHHHRGMLGYCRELNVPLEVFVNDNRAGLIQIDSIFGGKPQKLQRVIADMRGAIAALAATTKSVDAGLNALLQNFGDLQQTDLTYSGSSRAGYESPLLSPGGGDQPGTLQQPLPASAIAQANALQIIRVALTFPELWNQASTMLAPVGGMDRIVKALVKAAGDGIYYKHEVLEIARVGNRARIVALDHTKGRRTAFDVDYVICTIPLPVLKSIKADFSGTVKQAVIDGADVYFAAAKVAFEARQRWWEIDDDIYGGISWTGRDINQIWYPSFGFHGKKGIIVGAYVWDPKAVAKYGAMTPAQRSVAAIADGEALHPGYGTKVAHAASVVWPKVPFSLGGWAEWDFTPGSRQKTYPVLLAGDGPFYFAGEHMSYVNGWQEGAVQSAHFVVSQLAARAKAGQP